MCKFDLRGLGCRDVNWIALVHLRTSVVTMLILRILAAAGLPVSEEVLSL
jgi:hypothetical protein